MSQENVEVVRAGFEAWNAGDMDAWANLLAEDVVWRLPHNFPEPGPYIGRETVMRQVRQTREAWEVDSAEPSSTFLHTGDRVVVRFVWRGRGRGPESDMEVTCVYTVQRGRVTEFQFFWDHTDALEAAGLSE